LPAAAKKNRDNDQQSKTIETLCRAPGKKALVEPELTSAKISGNKRGKAPFQKILKLSGKKAERFSPLPPD